MRKAEFHHNNDGSQSNRDSIDIHFEATAGHTSQNQKLDTFEGTLD